MYVRHLALGDYQTNCYILTSPTNSDECILVDPGFGVDSLMSFLIEQHWNPVRIILTHGHCDHIAGISTLKKRFPDVPVAIGAGDADMLIDPMLNLSAMMRLNVRPGQADEILKEGDVITFHDVNLEVIETPGHTPGGLCFLNRKDRILISGDTLFAGSIGRTDFPGGSQSQLLRSIKEKLMVLPPDTSVHPGHGMASTIAQEAIGNQFLNGEIRDMDFY
ncbi:MAG: MBL fold metallo-hydrolase [Sedimentisphaerales bacterium]|nr:MBL fold metallo-hydrolase [Sedimentisphaerales bacterium]MBN2843071.1 MBL fold metallo-hydrolase [Sedimentisphaerales bacterium]